jgi:hypothetical protein
MQFNFGVMNGHPLARLMLIFLLGGMAISLGACGSGYSPPSYENVPVLLSQAPCVAGVCIGDADRQEIIEKLSQHELVSNIREGGGPIWFNIEGGGQGDIYFSRDRFGDIQVVETIGFVVVGMPLEKALNTLGDPDELFMMFGCGHGVHLHGRMFYRDEGIEVVVQFPVKIGDRASPVVLNDRTPVESISYFAPSEYDNWLSDIRENLRKNGYFSFASSATTETMVAAVQP